MAILDKIKGQSRINVNEVIDILKNELKVTDDTIEYDDDLLLNKYLKRLYKFRLLGNKRRW